MWLAVLDTSQFDGYKQLNYGDVVHQQCRGRELRNERPTGPPPRVLHDDGELLYLSRLGLSNPTLNCLTVAPSSLGTPSSGFVSADGLLPSFRCECAYVEEYQVIELRKERQRKKL